MKIWRYMDLASFLDLLVTESLFFRRADKFEDKLEASLPLGQQKIINQRKKQMRLNGVSAKDVNKFFRDDKKWNIWFRENTYLNCWHMNNKESIGMWNLYTARGLGVCIQSDYGRLERSFDLSPEAVCIGRLSYIDLSRDDVDIRDDNKFYPFLHKDISFSHEVEIRAVVCDRIGENGARDIKEKSQFTLGRNIRVDLKTLVEKIYVTPSSSPWFANLISSVVQKYGFDFQVGQSELIREPFFG